MNEVFLGLIALAVTVMAVIQVGVIVFAARAARRVGQAVARVEADIRPIVANLRAMSDDVVRTSSAAATQVERAGRVFDDLAARLEATVAALHDAVLGPARDALGVLQALRSVIAAFRSSPPARRPAGADDDDALFIG